MQLIRSITLTLAALLSAFTARSQQLDINSQLWKITGKGLPGPSYLLGTSHDIGGSFTDSFPPIGNAFRQAAIFVRETVPGPANTSYAEVLEFQPGIVYRTI